MPNAFSIVFRKRCIISRTLSMRSATSCWTYRCKRHATCAVAQYWLNNQHLSVPDSPFQYVHAAIATRKYSGPRFDSIWFVLFQNIVPLTRRPPTVVSENNNNSNTATNNNVPAAAAAATAAAAGASAAAAEAAGATGGANATGPIISAESNSIWIPMPTPSSNGANAANRNPTNDSQAGDNRSEILRNSEYFSKHRSPYVMPRTPINLTVLLLGIWLEFSRECDASHDQ